MTEPIIVWLRNDLRLSDNLALYQANKKGVPVLLLYVLDDEAAGTWRMGSASRWWLHYSLESLKTDLQKLGSDVILRRGSTVDVIIEISRQLGVKEIYCSKQFEPWARELEQILHQKLEEYGITLNCCAGQLLHAPGKLCTKIGKSFQVYTPFLRALTATDIRIPKPAPSNLLKFTRLPQSDTLKDWCLIPIAPDWAGGMRKAWQPGETGAQKRLNSFLEKSAATYHINRDRPKQPYCTASTSKLSPHLHFGEITPAICWHAAKLKAAQDPTHSEGLEIFLKELAWREFSYHLIYHSTDLPAEPFRKRFVSFPWQPPRKVRSTQLKAWQQGKTGYPIIDAGLRELWTTGWMHNRVRMIAASFLTKHLLIPWQQGQDWFWDCLVDANLASNSASWQWVSGCGADAAPYFRIFNPVIQGQKFDADGTYVRFWVPEIAKIPNKYIHTPWLCPKHMLDMYNIKIGVTYPLPIVDHKQARDRALEAYQFLKSTTP